MTAKINIAKDQYGNYVKIGDAMRGQKYYCLHCGEKLIANKGTKNIHFYKHYNKDKNEIIECELYSSSKSVDIEQLEEHLYENKARFIVDDSFNLNMKIPHLDSKSMVRMNNENLYFSINLQNHRIHSTNLGKGSKQNYLSVTPKVKYRLEVENKRNAITLGYVIEENIQLLEREVLLFKKISGEYINIPYQKTNLSDEFYLLSMVELKIPEELIQINYKNSNSFHFYHCCLEVLTDTLKEWFMQETGYTIVSNRKWMDLIYPSTFQYSDASILIQSNKALIKVTEHSKNERIFYLDQDGEIEYLKVDGEGIAHLNLEYNHIYNLHLDHEISNEISVKRVKSVEPSSNYTPDFLIDSELSTINNQTFERRYSIESDIDFFVYSNANYPYRTRSLEKQLPEALHFPHIGTIYKFKNKSKETLLSFELLFTSEQWQLVKNSEFMYVMKMVNKSHNQKRALYIAELIKNYNKLPEKLIKIIRGGLSE